MAEVSARTHVYFPIGVRDIILDYSAEWELLDWIDESMLQWPNICRNPRAMKIIAKNMDIVDWHQLSRNPGAIPLLLLNKDKICWLCLSKNTGAGELFREHPFLLDTCALSKNPAGLEILEKDTARIYWKMACKNPAAEHLVKANPGQIYWDCISANPSPWAIKMLWDNLDSINWSRLAKNPAAIDILIEHGDLDTMPWTLAGNPSPRAFELFKKMKISKYPLGCRYHLCKNPAAIDFLKENQKIIDWAIMSSNPGIFELKVSDELREILSGK